MISEDKVTAAAPSNTFLFDQHRSGRSLYTGGTLQSPTLVWQFRTPSYPPKGPESSPVFDAAGNLYFGSHDGCFYSLDPLGNLRWMYKTADKIYSSATLRGDRIVVCSGDGNCFCFDLTGTLLWVYHASNFFKRGDRSLRTRLARWHTKRASRDHVRGKYRTTLCWSSTLIGDNDVVYITSYGLGLHALSLEDGSLLWSHDLHQPRSHLSGVAMDGNGRIIVASQRHWLHCLDADNGGVQWQARLTVGFDTWSNPSVDIETQTIYQPISKQESDSYIRAFDYDGALRWSQRIRGGVRGSVAISREDYVLIGGLDGHLYFLRKTDGEVIRRIHLSDAERGLWTTPSIDPSGDIYLTVKATRNSGALYRFNSDGEQRWKYDCGKALSVPIIDDGGRVYFGSWCGHFLCLQT